MRKARNIFLISSLLCISSCSSISNLNPLGLLTGNQWKLAGMMGEALGAGTFADALPMLSFLEGGKLSGFTGCNNFSGDFNLDGKNISLNPGAVTKKACPGSGENEFLGALSKVTNFKVDKNLLTLMDGGKELLSFIPEN